MTSPIDHYYEVLDYINALEELVVFNKQPIDNKHKMAKHLHELFKLSQIAEREYWESIDVRMDEE